MGRIVNVASTGSERARLRRTVAEALHCLVAKRELDDEARDQAALIALCLRQIAAGVEHSAAVWDGRHYYLKADALRREWEWADRSADRLKALILAGDWARLPVALAALVPRFADVRVARITRSETLWAGAMRRLTEE